MCVKGGMKGAVWAAMATLLWLMTTVAQAQDLTDSMRLAPGDQKVLTFPWGWRH